MTSIAFNISNTSSPNAVIKCIDSFIKLLINIAEHSNDLNSEINYCIEIRRKRKSLTKHLSKILDNYSGLKSNQRINLVETLHQAIVKLEHSKSDIKVEIKKIHRPLISHFVCRELNENLKSFKKIHSKFSDLVIKSKIDAVNRNPELKENLRKAWGELALED